MHFKCTSRLVLLAVSDGAVCLAANISYNFMGCILSVFVGGAVLPIAFALFWSGCTALGACVGTLMGGCLGIITWVVTAMKMYEEASVLSLQNNEPLLAGCCVGVGMAAIICTLLVSPACHLLTFLADVSLALFKHLCESSGHAEVLGGVIIACTRGWIVLSLHVEG